MIPDIHPVLQAALGSLLTWGLTAAGSAMVFLIPASQRKVLDTSLGFAAGVMTAASYWSLLAPAIDLSEEDPLYGKSLSFVPAFIGFFIGAVFVYAADLLLPSDHDVMGMILKRNDDYHYKGSNESLMYVESNSGSGDLRRRKGYNSDHNLNRDDIEYDKHMEKESWRHILLLIIAITVHNIPEGLAVGVGFGAVQQGTSATFESARNLAIGIGIQNFPEGMAVSLPLRSAGMSFWRSFWYGQLSGMVEPVAAIFGAVAVQLGKPLLPYALSFAAGAMIFVVVDDIIPEANSRGNGKLASWGCVVGFLVMMSLDVGLG